MGVPCPTCGRTYDVTLFEFGRTLHCTCGARVRHTERVVQAIPEAGPCFLADAMLGRLAHWLRLLGFDCAYERDISDRALVERALRENRVILTRDRRLPEEWTLAAVYVVSARETLDQLAEVVRRFDLADRIDLFSRCSRCNVALLEASRQEAKGRVPPRIVLMQTRFRRCPCCGRVYWEGSHTSRMRRVVERIVAAD